MGRPKSKPPSRLMRVDNKFHEKAVKIAAKFDDKSAVDITREIANGIDDFTKVDPLKQLRFFRRLD